jgi:small-conductance mechanosensitive channel
MNGLFSEQRIGELLQMAYQWVLDNVFVLANAFQLIVVVATLGLALLLSRRLRGWIERHEAHPGVTRVYKVTSPLLLPLVWFVLQWLSIAAATSLGLQYQLIDIVATLLTAWVAIRLVSQLVKNPVWATLITWIAWTIAALQILNWLDPVIGIMNSAAITFGGLRISLYTVAKSTLALAVLLYIALYLAGVLESRIRTSRALSPSVQVLFAKSLKTVLVGLAVLIAVRSVGIDLTALTVLGGAVGLGVGFGLQKVASNLVSGVILLIDKSIKPGDVIAVAGTYGWVTALGGRYVSVVTRDGVEHLIPNETLISERVENWTHSNSRTRQKIDIGVHYDSDVRKAIQLCLDAAASVPRVLKNPEPVCLLIGFGDSSVDLQLRIWIGDAQNGVQNVKSAVLLEIWDLFKEHGIQIPYPQRDVHLKSGAAELMSGARPATVQQVSAG